MIGNEYSPKAGPELAVYEGLWKVASPSGADLSGKDAVEFFRKSGVDSGFLKQIWGLSTPSATMNHGQFVTALRFITMVQNGDFPLTRERLISCADTNYGPANNFPKFASIQLNLAAAATVNPVTPSRSLATSVSIGALVPVTPETAVYAMTPEDHLKYYNLFKVYDIDGDGLLSGGEAVAVFAQSGLDQLILRAIWELADQDRDNQLNSKEFSVAFHLIICVSKKKLALPVTLPPPLLNFLKNAPLIPGGAPHTAAAGSTSVGAVAPPQQQQNLHPSQSQPITVNIPEPSMTAASVHAVSIRSPPRTPGASRRDSHVITVSESDEEQLTNSVTSIRDISRRALQAGDMAVEANITSSNQLKTVLQRLAQEKIALTSAVSSAETSAQESAIKLSSIVEEVTALEAELSELRRQLDDTRSASTSTQGQLSERTIEKQALLNKITETRAAIAHQSNDLSALAVDVGKSEGQRAELDEKEQSLSSDMLNIKKDVSNINNELVVLQSILMALNGDVDARGAELTRLQSQKNASQNALTRQRGSIEKQEQELSELKKEKVNLEHTRQEMIQKVSQSVGTACTFASTSQDSHDSKPMPHTEITTVAAAITTSTESTTGSSGNRSPVKPTGAPLSVDTAAAVTVAGAGIAGVESTPSKASPALSLSPPKSALPRSNSSLRNSNKISSAAVSTTAAAAGATTAVSSGNTATMALEKKASAHSLKRSKGSGNNSSTNKILIRTHSMNNKNGEVDPFDDFGAPSPPLSAGQGGVTSTDGSPRSPRSPSIISGEEVVPFDVDFNSSELSSPDPPPGSGNAASSAGAGADGNGDKESHRFSVANGGGFDDSNSTSIPSSEGFGFEKNPFDEPFDAVTQSAVGADDAFATSRSEGNKSVHFTPSTKAPAADGFDDLNDGFGGNDDGFGSSGNTSDGFDKNPFDDPVAFDAFSSSSASSAFGASPFDAFGSDFVAPANTAATAASSSGKTPVSGFDDW